MYGYGTVYSPTVTRTVLAVLVARQQLQIMSRKYGFASPAPGFPYFLCGTMCGHSHLQASTE